MLHSLAQRKLMSAVLRVARFLIPDKSPQGGWDYLCTTEERAIRPVPLRIPRDRSGRVLPFEGFKYERRHMPLGTVARGQSGTAATVENIKHGAAMESGDLHGWRYQTKGVLLGPGLQ